MPRLPPAPPKSPRVDPLVVPGPRKVSFAASKFQELKSDQVTSDDLCDFAKNIAQVEILKAQENLRVSRVIKKVRPVSFLCKIEAQATDGGALDDALLNQLESLDNDGDGEISVDEVVAFAKNFAAQQVELADEHARADAAKAEAKQLRARLFYAISAVVIMAALLTLSTAVTFLGTNRVVKKYHYTETRGAMLTNEDGETLACASAEFALGGAGNASSTLVSREGVEIATKSADPIYESKVNSRIISSQSSIAGDLKVRDLIRKLRTLRMEK